MLKKTIKYNDFNGDAQEETFYFNLSKAELVEMNLSEKGGLQDYFAKIVAEEDGREIVRLLREIVKSAYGVRSEDGKRFIKSEKNWEEFASTEALDELLFGLYTDSVQSIAFMRGIVPSELSEQMQDYDNLSDEEIRKKAIEQMQGHKSKATKQGE